MAKILTEKQEDFLNRIGQVGPEQQIFDSEGKMIRYQEVSINNTIITLFRDIDIRLGNNESMLYITSTGGRYSIYIHSSKQIHINCH